MDRQWKSGASGSPPTLDNASSGYATAGNPGTGTPATKPGPHWFHMITEELLAVVTAAGITFDKTVVTQVRDAIYALIRGATQTTTSTGTQNDFAVTAARRLTLRCNNASLLTFNGFAAGSDGDEIEIVSVGAGQVDIANQNAGSSAANRAINPVTGTISLAPGPGSFARLRYDATASRWRVMVHEQGAWITPTFSAGDYTASGAMTWTLQSGDVLVCAYMLRGKTLHVQLNLRTTTVGGTPDIFLQRAVPGGFTAARANSGCVATNDNGVLATGYWDTTNGTVIRFSKLPFGTGTWGAATNTTEVIAEPIFDVQ